MTLMSVRIIDLSVPLESFPSEYHDVLVSYWDHRDGARRLARDWKVNPADLPSPHVGTAAEDVTAFSHAGTHLDAPWHFGPLTEGRPGKTIDEIPLEWCFGDGVVLDFSTSKKDGEYIDVPDVQAALEEIGYRLKPWDIVMFRTGAGDHWGAPDYGARGSGLTAEAVFWLYRQGIKILTTDAYTMDIPIPRMVERFKAGEKEAFFPVHRAGRKVEYTHAEKVVNLHLLPSTGFKVALFPVKIRRGSGAWIRAVAIFDDALHGRKQRFVDLSVPLENFAADYHQASITYWDHYDFARRAGKVQSIDPKDFPEPCVGGSMESVTTSAHAGTFVAAPWYFGPQVAGEPARTIDHVPLDWCYGNAVVLDFSARKKRGDYISVADLESELAAIDHRLAPGDIVMLRTGAGERWGAPDYVEHGAGLSGEAVRWLVRQGIKLVTTDAATIDIPLPTMIERFRGGDRDALFQVVNAGRDVEFVFAAKVVNLQQLPRTGFKVALFPVKLRRGSGSWTRAVAMFND
jgi:kynurenine formamidase